VIDKDLASIKIALSKLKIIDLSTPNAYTLIQNILKDDITLLALLGKTFEPGMLLYRCRKNENYEIFNSIEDLTYRKDLEKIEKYGRANEPLQSIFYAADFRATAIGEVHEAFRGEKYKNINEISTTTSCWKVVKNLDLTLMIGNSKAQEANELINIYSTDIKELVSNEFGSDLDKVFEINNYFSDEFAYDIKDNPDNYKICCAFAQLAYQNSDGIAYPSLQRKFEGLNFAIKPESVREKLQFVCAVHDKFKKVEEKRYTPVESTATINVEGNTLIWGEPQIINGC
jgi:hypothetical protein